MSEQENSDQTTVRKIWDCRWYHSSKKRSPADFATTWTEISLSLEQHFRNLFSAWFCDFCFLELLSLRQMGWVSSHFKLRMRKLDPKKSGVRCVGWIPPQTCLSPSADGRGSRCIEVRQGTLIFRVKVHWDYSIFQLLSLLLVTRLLTTGSSGGTVCKITQTMYFILKEKSHSLKIAPHSSAKWSSS